MKKNMIRSGKEIIKKRNKVLAVIWIVFFVLTLLSVILECVLKGTGQYVTTTATITYVHEYDHKGINGPDYKAANGYISWDYNGVTHKFEDEKKHYLDLSHGAKVGDTISIWIDARNGNFIDRNNSSIGLGRIIALFIFFGATYPFCKPHILFLKCRKLKSQENK